MDNFVYKIESPSGKYYIGSTNNIQRRFREHTEGCKNPHSLYIQNASAKYGSDKMKISILATCDTRQEAYAIEQEYLDKHFEDELCMNVGKGATGFNSETAKQAGNHPNRFDIASYMKANPHKHRKKGEGKSKKKKKKLNPINKQEAEIQLTTREFKEWCKNNRPDAYALKNPEGDIIYVKHHGLQQFCRENKLNCSHLYSRGNSNGWFFTKDLSKQGIDTLKKAKAKVSKGNSKLVKIYKDNVYVDTIENLKQWCCENNVNYNSANNLVRGVTKTPTKGYTFEYVN